MVKSNDIQEQFIEAISALTITSDDEEIKRLSNVAVECIRILEQVKEINQPIVINGKENTPLDLIHLFDSHDEKRLNNAELLKLEKVIKQAGGKTRIDVIIDPLIELTNEIMKVLREYQQIFLSLSKRIVKEVKNSSDSIKLKKLFKIIEKQIEYFSYQSNKLQNLRKEYASILEKERSSIFEGDFSLLQKMLKLTEEGEEIIKKLIAPFVKIIEISEAVSKIIEEERVREYYENENIISSSFTGTAVELPQQKYCSIM